VNLCEVCWMRPATLIQLSISHIPGRSDSKGICEQCHEEMLKEETLIWRDNDTS